MDSQRIKRVRVVFKTHLDMGFTDLAENIQRKYDEVFIPRALDTAEAMNTEVETPFIWTVGAYIIDRYLKTAPPDCRKRLERAITRGWITWHALPFTTHSELMDESLFRYGLELSAALDARFGKHTIAAKMSDVPGHTAAVIPLLAEAGVTYLHVGANRASRLPEVPRVFRWQCGGHEVLVQYAAWYGENAVIEGLDEALVFMHAHDNEGPPSPKEVQSFFAELRAEFPNAYIAGSTLDAFAAALCRVRDTLPIVTQEIGDTWIHGCATDPYKVGAFERLLSLRTKWEKKPPKGYTAVRDAFSSSLLLVAEHTWGMDTKKYLYDYRNWEKTDFQTARKHDVLTPDDMEPAEACIRETVLRETAMHSGGLHGCYSLFERSHAEQRAYISEALSALTPALRLEAESAVTRNCAIPLPAGMQVTVGDTFSLGNLSVRLEDDGSVRLEDGARLGAFCYQVFDSETVERCYHDYNRLVDITYGWSNPDFAKPGLERVRGLKKADYTPRILSATLENESLTVHLACAPEADVRFGCPRRLALCYHAEQDGLKLSLTWMGKDASRIPEALWLGMYPSEGTAWNGVQINKLGRWLSAYDVVPGGNRHLHGVQAVRFGKYEFRCADAPVISVGGRLLYDTNDRYGASEKGVHFLLYNNRWGTNFKMWYEEDARIDVFVKIDSEAVR